MGRGRGRGRGREKGATQVGGRRAQLHSAGGGGGERERESSSAAELAAGLGERLASSCATQGRHDIHVSGRPDGHSACNLPQHCRPACVVNRIRCQLHTTPLLTNTTRPAPRLNDPAGPFNLSLAALPAPLLPLALPALGPHVPKPQLELLPGVQEDGVSALRQVELTVRVLRLVKISCDAALAVQVVAGGAVDLDPLVQERGGLGGVGVGRGGRGAALRGAYHLPDVLL